MAKATTPNKPNVHVNYAWVQYFLHHPAPTGMADFVLANGTKSSNQSGEGETYGIALAGFSLPA